MMENEPENHSASPLQFDLSPAVMRVAAPPAPLRVVASPVPTHNESDSESLGGSQSSRTSSSMDEDDFLAKLTLNPDAEGPPPLPTRTGGSSSRNQTGNLPQISSGRRFLSMSANIFMGRQSPPNTQEPKKGSPVKKNLFAAIADDDEVLADVVPMVVSDSATITATGDDEDSSSEPQIPFRWERSASMVDLSFVVPTAAAAPVASFSGSLRQSPPPLSSNRFSSLSSVPTVQPVAVPVARSITAASPRSSSLVLPQVTPRDVRPFQQQDPLRRRGTVFVDTQDRRESAEKKRAREGMPAPMPAPQDLHRKSSDVAVQVFGSEFRMTLPLVQNLKHDGINTISCATVSDILKGKFAGQFDHIYILDCRFDFEYHGGHIRGAIHANDPEVLVERFFKHRVEGKACFIFHCEFSSKRGPAQLKLMRELDRKANQEAYPRLFYPELYLMENGYCGFFSEFREQCTPEAYIRMDDERFRTDCLKGNLMMRSTLKKKRRPSLNATESDQ